MKVAVITISDRVSRGEAEDLSGPEMVKILKEALPDSEITTDIVPDEYPAIFDALIKAGGNDWIFTSGGTGPGPRDITPEASAAFVDRLLPGLAEYLRTESLKETPNAVFSRGIAGMRGKCFLVNAPGSRKGAALCARIFAPIMAHGHAMAFGQGHSH